MSAAKLKVSLTYYLDEVGISDVVMGEVVVDEGRLYVVGHFCNDMPSYRWVRDLIGRCWIAVPDQRRVVVVMKVEVEGADFVPGSGGA